VDLFLQGVPVQHGEHMQAHPSSARRFAGRSEEEVEARTYIVNYRLRVEAGSWEDAAKAFYHVVCGGDRQGEDWSVIEDQGIDIQEIDLSDTYVKVVKEMP